jgi:hypothetical protein
LRAHLADHCTDLWMPPRLNSYENLILLCKMDHKWVDDQPTTFGESHLKDAKRRHEAWVHSTLEPTQDVAPIRVRRHPGAPEPLLHHLRTGAQVWDIIAGAQAWLFHLEDDHGRGDEETELAEEFLDVVRDYAEISAEVADVGSRAVREAKRGFHEHLESLAAHGLVVFGGREDKIIEGGVLPPAQSVEATVTVRSTERAIAYAQESKAHDADLPT